MTALEPALIDPLVERLDAVRDMFGKCVVDLAEFVEHDNLYGVIDPMGEMDDLLEQWTVAADDVDAADGWPDLPPELRAQLLASRENLEDTDEAAPRKT